MNMIRKVKIKDIRPNRFQPRKSQDDEAIKGLAEEISRVGLWGGALRGRQKEGYVELCFGHRRLEAVKLLGWKEVDVDVVRLSDEDMALQALIENMQRAGLDEIEKGEGIARYIQLRLNSHNSTQGELLKEVGDLIGIGKTWANELLKLSRMDEDTKKTIRKSKMSGKTAALAASIGKEDQKNAVEKVAEKGMKYQTLQEINTEMVALPDKTAEDKEVKEKVRKSFVKVDIDKSADVITKAKQFRSAA